METRTSLLNFENAQRALGADMRKLLPFAHAMSGSDTTSAIYGYGKKKINSLIESDTSMQRKALLFGHATATKQELSEAGEALMVAVYNGKAAETSLSRIRYQQFLSPK